MRVHKWYILAQNNISLKTRVKVSLHRLNNNQNTFVETHFIVAVIPEQPNNVSLGSQSSGRGYEHYTGLKSNPGYHGVLLMDVTNYEVCLIAL